VKKTERIQLLTEAFQVLLDEGAERAFVVIENADAPDEFVQVQLHDGAVYGEVGSREWDEPARPLGDAAVIRLGRANFRGGGPEHNYCRDGLPTAARPLANLVDRLFAAAYGPRREVDYVLGTNSHAVENWLRETGRWFRELPQRDDHAPRPLSLGVVRDFLQSRNLKVFHDAKGDLMTFWGWDEDLGSEVKVWFKVECEGNLYRIAATNDRPVRRESWDRVIRACNRWNDEHRWPKAYLSNLGQDPDGQVFGWVETGLDLPAATGVHRAFIEDYTEALIKSNLEFFAWMNSEVGWATVSMTEVA
jgi:hypothetical protein